MSEFRRKFNRAVGAALMALGAVSAATGVYKVGDGIATVAQNSDAYKQGEACKKSMDAGKACSLEDTQKAVFTLNTDRKGTEGAIGMLLGGMTGLIGAVSFRAHRKKPEGPKG